MARKIDVANAIINDLQWVIDRAEALINSFSKDWGKIRKSELDYLKSRSNEIERNTNNMHYDTDSLLIKYSKHSAGCVVKRKQPKRARRNL